MEEELAAMYGIEEEEKKEYMGDAEKPEFVWRHAGGAPCGRHPASDEKDRRWKRLQRRFEDVDLAIRKSSYAAIENALRDLSQDIAKSGKSLGYKGAEEKMVANL